MKKTFNKPLGSIPDLERTYGKAWRCDLSKIREKFKVAPSNDATIGVWVVFAPYAHPLWSYYMISVIHLRTLADGREAKINLKDATHEIWVYAMSPDEEPSLELPMRQILMPPNFIGQFICVGDIEASTVLDKTVEDVIEGNLNPDTDYRQTWIHRFSDSNIKK